MAEFNPTQLDMFKNMPGIDDDDDTQQVADNGNETEQTEPQPSGTQEAETATSTTEAAQEPAQQPSGDITSNKDNVQPTPATTGPVRADGLVAVPDPTNPKVTNLVDPRTGQVVVPAGSPRRFYDNLQRTQRELQVATGRSHQLETELNAFKQANVAAQQYQLAPNEQVDAMRLMADFKKNPAATLQRIVEEAQAAGIDLPFLQNGGMAPSVIEGIIDRKLAPITVPQQQAQAAAQAQAQAAKTLDRFIESNDTAQVHLPLIAEMLSSNPNATLESAYIQVIQFAAEHGLDIHQPLKPQIEARQRAATGAQPRNSPASAATTTPARALPNGRSASAGATMVDDVAEYGAQDSWDTIIRDSLRRNGV